MYDADSPPCALFIYDYLGLVDWAMVPLRPIIIKANGMVLIKAKVRFPLDPAPKQIFLLMNEISILYAIRHEKCTESMNWTSVANCRRNGFGLLQFLTEKI